MEKIILEKIKAALKGHDYDFLRTHENLGDNIILMGLGGSYAYGTYNDGSDIDVRGIATNRVRDILCYRDFEQVVDITTDTTIYSLDKMMKLLANCNPNTIELLGLDEDQYLKITPEGQLLLDNKKLFLSKLAVNTFGGYADAQLRRLENKSARKSMERQEEHILRSIENSYVHFAQKFLGLFASDGSNGLEPRSEGSSLVSRAVSGEKSASLITDSTGENSIRLHIGPSSRPEMVSEIYMDVVLNNYPLRDYADLWGEMNNIVKSYGKIGKRNEKAASHNKLGKHMMHLVRLYLMCFDILERGEIVTNRVAEHDMLMEIRNGKYLDSEEMPTPEFYELLAELEKKLEYDKNNNDLPDKPDEKKIRELEAEINSRVVLK